MRHCEACAGRTEIWQTPCPGIPDEPQLPCEICASDFETGRAAICRDHYGQVVQAMEKYSAEADALRKIVDARLCDKHASADGLFGHEQGEPTTPAGGGCAVCIGERIERERDAIAKEKDALFRQTMITLKRWKDMKVEAEAERDASTGRQRLLEQSLETANERLGQESSRLVSLQVEYDRLVAANENNLFALGHYIAAVARYAARNAKLERVVAALDRCLNNRGAYSCAPTHDCRCEKDRGMSGNCTCGADELSAAITEVEKDDAHAPAS